MPVTTEIRANHNQRYLLLRHSGALTTAAIKASRQQTQPIYQLEKINRVLVDYRQADLRPLSLLELDNLASDFAKDLPDCRFMALIHAPDSDITRLSHIKNVCFLGGVLTELFDNIALAENWLSQPEPLNHSLTG